MKTMIEEYFENVVLYQNKYGPQTVLVYMKGHFYEIYGIDNDTTQLGLVIYDVSSLLNIQLTRSSKKILENNMKNPLMIGVPIHALDKYCDILTDNGYTVVVYNQTTPSPNIIRELYKIYSPGTNINKTNPNNNYILSVYIEQDPYIGYSVGLAVLDVATGYSVCYESYSSKEDTNFSLDETLRFIQTYNPSEILIYSKNLSLTQAELTGYFEIKDIPIHWMLNITPKEFSNISYQTQFLSKIYKNIGLLSPIEYIDLERMPIALISFIILLQFAYEHDETFINNLQKPEIWYNDKHLILANNAISQLNLTGNGNRKTGSVLNIINNTKTSMGNRLLRDKLLNPIIDCEELTNRYNIIDAFISNRQLLETINKILGEIPDIEKLHRKMSLKLLRPCDFEIHLNSCENIKNLLTHTSTGCNLVSGLLPDSTVIASFEEYVKICNNSINIQEASKYALNNITNNFFHRGYNQELDTLDHMITKCTSFFETLAEKLGEIIGVVN